MKRFTERVARRLSAIAVLAPLALASPMISTPAFAQGLTNGDFETRSPGPGSSGMPTGTCTTGNPKEDYAPTPWSKQSTPDYQTQNTIAFHNDFRARSTLPGFDASPTGGCFIGFRSLTGPLRNEGVYQTINVVDADQPLQWIYDYTEYTKPGQTRCTPNVEFRVNSTDDSNGTTLAAIPSVGAAGEGTWVRGTTPSFKPSDYGIADGGTMNVYLGVIANGCVWTWGYVDTLEIVLAKETDLETDKTLASGDATPEEGDTVKFEITVKNNGPDDATNVTLTDDLPAGLTATLNNGSVTAGSYSDVTGIWTIGDLADGASATLTLEGTVDAGQGGATITNTTTAAAGDQDDPGTTGDDLTEAVVVANDPAIEGDLTSSISDDTGTVGLSVGDTLTYSIVVTNTGNVTLTHTGLNDMELKQADGDVIPGLDASDFTTSDPTTLAPGKSATYTATYVLTQDDVDAGGLDADATVEGTPPVGADVTDDTGADDVVTATPVIDGAMTSDITHDTGPVGLSAGDTLTYSIVIENTGNVTLSDVGVDSNDLTRITGGASVTLPASAFTTSDATTLAPGEKATFTADYVLTQADIDAGGLDHDATVIGTPPAGSDVTDDTDVDDPVTAAPTIEGVLSSTISDDTGLPGLTVGDTLTYSIVVTNTGNVTLTHTGLNDVELKQADGDVIPGLDASDFTTADATTLAPGESATYTATYVLTQDDVDGGGLDADATVEGTPPVGADVTDDTDVEDSVDPDPSIDGVMTSDITDDTGDAGLSAGDTLTYSIVIENTGNVTLSDVGVDSNDLTQSRGGAAVTLPASAFTTADATTLAPGEKATFTADYVLTQADIDEGGLDHDATVIGTPPTGSDVTDDTMADDDATAAPAINGALSSAVTDDTGPAGLSVGDTLTYSIVVTNTGNVTLTDAGLNDLELKQADGDVIPGLDASDFTTADATTLAPGESATYTATYVLTQDDVDAGGLDVDAIVEGTPPTGSDVTDDTDATDPITMEPEIEGVMASTITNDTGSSGLSAGDTLTYSVTIENTGNVTLNDVAIDSNGLTQINGGAPVTLPTSAFTTADATTLAPGETATFTAEYVLTQVDIDAGGLDHTAIVIGTSPAAVDVTDVTDDGNPGDDGPDAGSDPGDDPLRDAVEGAPLLTVKKTVNEAALNDGVDEGDTLIYTITVENKGNVTLHDMVLSDLFTDGNGDALILDSFDTDVRMDITKSIAADGSVLYDTGENLDVGETWSFTARFMLTADAIASGGVENVVVATGTTFGGDEVSAESKVEGNSSDDGDGEATETGFPGEITGTVRNYLSGASGIQVRLTDEATGDVVDTAVTDSSGTYTFLNLKPGAYSVEFVNPDATGPAPKAISPEYEASDNRITRIDVDAGVVEVEQNAFLVDPSGVVYDSLTYAPIAGATVTLLYNGSPVPNSWLDTTLGDSNGTVTGADGMYTFFLDPAAASNGVYTLQVSQGDYLFESSLTPATSGPYVPGRGGGVEEISADAIPTAGSTSTYYLDFDFVFDPGNLAATSNGVVRNHIPLDQNLLPTVVEDLLTILEDDLAATLTQQSRQMERYADGALQRLKSRSPSECLAAVTDVLSKERILFDTDQAIIRPESGPVLDEIAGILGTCDGALFEIAGHTDADADADYNQRLSKARVEAVIAALSARDVSTAGFIARGYGESRPIASNATEEGKAQNRRVVFRLLDEGEHAHEQCYETVDTSGGFVATTSDGRLDMSGDYRREQRHCAADAWSIFDVSVSYFDSDNGVNQSMLNMSYRRERFVNDNRVRGYFLGAYHSQNDVSGLAIGDIEGLGLNGGIYGADRFNNGLFMDFYLGLATGRHDFDLDFARAGGPVNARGHYTYMAGFAGAAVSGETFFGSTGVSPRVGIDTAYSPGGDVDVTVARGALNQAGNLSLDSVSGGRIFAEVRIDAFNEWDNMNVAITPRVACNDDIGSTSSECGFGGSIELSDIRDARGTTYSLLIDGEGTDSFGYGAVSFNVAMPVFGGMWTTNTDVATSEAVTIGSYYTLEF